MDPRNTNAHAKSVQQFVVTTQYLENYGAQNDDGLYVNDNARWKAKGGTDYIIESINPHFRGQDAMAFVMAKHSKNTISQKEFPLRWTTYDEWLEELEAEDDMLEGTGEYTEFKTTYAEWDSPDEPKAKVTLMPGAKEVSLMLEEGNPMPDMKDTFIESTKDEYDYNALPDPKLFW